MYDSTARTMAQAPVRAVARHAARSVTVWIPALRRGAPSPHAIAAPLTPYPTKSACLLHPHLIEHEPYAAARPLHIRDGVECGGEESAVADVVAAWCEALSMCGEPGAAEIASLIRSGRRGAGIAALFARAAGPERD